MALSSKPKKRKPLSDEHKRKIGESGKGRKVSQETIQKRKETRAKHGPYEKLQASALRMGKANQGTKQSEETIQKKREVGLRLASDPEYLARVGEGVKRAYENPEYRERNRQMLDSVRDKAVAKNRNVPLSEKRKAHLAETSRRAKNAYWANKTYEERREFAANLRIASESVRVSSLEVQVKKLLDTMGFQYEQQKQVGMYWVDFYLPEINLIVNVNGCYWHACSQCGYTYEKKQKYDHKREAQMRAWGYEILTIWEHDLVEHNE